MERHWGGFAAGLPAMGGGALGLRRYQGKAGCQHTAHSTQAKTLCKWHWPAIRASASCMGDGRATWRAHFRGIPHLAQIALGLHGLCHGQGGRPEVRL